jgi:replicative superfamily II helicase
VSKEGRELIKPLPAGSMIANDKLMEMERVIIHDAFLISLFQILVDTPTMTATEVLERAREKGMLLAPTAGRLQAEWLGPMIEREITCSRARGCCRPAADPARRGDRVQDRVRQPDVAHGARRARRGLHARPVERRRVRQDDGRRRAARLVQLRRATPAILDIHGAPMRALDALAEEVAARRDGRAQAAQQQQMVDAAPALARPLRRPPPDSEKVKPACLVLN